MLLMNRGRSSKGRIIIISGPSGAGKTTLHDLLLAAPQFHQKIVRSISATTRQPRGAEQNGRDYFFISKKMFENKIRRGHFLEWAKVFDQYYGTPAKNVRDILLRGQNVLLCIDVQGGKQVRAKEPDVLSIFVCTPDLDILRQRLSARKTDSEEAVALRIKIAADEMKEAVHYDYCIVNDNLDDAFAELTKIIDCKINLR